MYLIPGNPKIDMDKDLPHWHNYLMTDDENIKKAFVRTDDIERMKAGEYLPIIATVINIHVIGKFIVLISTRSTP